MDRVKEKTINQIKELFRSLDWQAQDKLLADLNKEFLGLER